MGDYIPPLTTCPTCDGDGFDGGAVCPVCLGTGTTPVMSKTLLLFKSLIDQCSDIMDKCNDVMDKCDDIFEKVNE